MTVTRFVVLYVTLFIAFGALSPFLPEILSARGLGADVIGVALAAGTAARLIAGPAVGRIADLSHAPRAVLSISILLAAFAAILYLPAHHQWALFAISLVQAMALAPIVPIADALSLAASRPGFRPSSGERGFDYGWVRGAGSASFIAGVVVSGRLIGISGLNSTLGLNALLLIAAAFITVFVPNRITTASGKTARSAVARVGIRNLMQNSTFRCVLIVAALVEGSHAMHDGFAVIRWRAAGIGPFSIALLWSEGVAGEIIVFLFAGRQILDRLGPGRSLMLAAAAGVLRWGVLAQATRVGVIALVEPLHGLTFALLHLACMQVIQRTVPGFLAATAQTVYGTLAIGLMTSLLTLCSGILFARLGASGFWAMSGICLLAIPFARRLELLTNERERS